jgi:two-component system, LytTR family, sensor kinase
MILVWLFFSIFYILCFRLYTMHVNPLIYSAYGMPYRMHSASFVWDFFDLFGQINMEGCLAAAIKLGKMWYIKQQELELIKSERKKTEDTQQDGVMKPQPAFFINALDKIEMLSREKPEAIPGMMKKIKNLLLYVVFDNNQPKVKLAKELALLKEYIDLEEESLHENIKITVRLPDHTNDEKIAPFIILPLVENSFHQLSLLDMPDKFMNLEANLYERNFHLNVEWSKPVDSSTLANGGNAFLNTIHKRLQLLYPQGHELIVIIKPAIFLVRLQINLDRSLNYL